MHAIRLKTCSFVHVAGLLKGTYSRRRRYKHGAGSSSGQIENRTGVARQSGGFEKSNFQLNHNIIILCTLKNTLCLRYYWQSHLGYNISRMPTGIPTRFSSQNESLHIYTWGFNMSERRSCQRDVHHSRRNFRSY